MLKKKPAKRAKKKMSAKSKHTSQKSVLTIAEKVEKEFDELPAKLSRLYRQELLALQSQTAKLEAALKKAVQAKQSALTKIKPSLSKKRLRALNKVQKQAEKTIRDLTKQLDSLEKMRVRLAAKQEKYDTLHQRLFTLEKQLNKKPAAPVKIRNKTKVKKVKKEETKNISLQPTHTAISSEETSVTTPAPTETVEME